MYFRSSDTVGCYFAAVEPIVICRPMVVFDLECLYWLTFSTVTAAARFTQYFAVSFFTSVVSYGISFRLMSATELFRSPLLVSGTNYHVHVNSAASLQVFS